jgi:class 3 adenylate cyclase
MVAKFQQEIESLTRLDDPGVVGIFDAGVLNDGTPYLVLQYVDGFTLRLALKPGGMDFEQTALIMKQVCRSVTAAHEAGILHRDLKPENILLQQTAEGQRVKIIDFGVAKVRDSVSSVNTATGLAPGTVGYMSPEQLSAKPLTPASDIYALGMIAYEMLTGRRPFNPDSPFQLLDEQRTGVRLKLEDLRPNLPAAAATVIMKALAFDPGQRFQRARDFGDQLTAALTGSEGEGTRLKLQSSDTVVSEAGQQTIDQVPKLETAHVLLMDLVGYSTLLIDHQSQRLQQLQEIVRNTEEIKSVVRTEELLRLPTGDGMALVFFRDPEAATRCAVEISRALRAQPEICLRMGVHTGPVYRLADINANMNVAGGGINMAQRVMDCGDVGHILVSQRVADDLIQLSRWAPAFHDLGEAEVKHGVRIHVYNLFADDFGNPEVPARFRVKSSRKIPVRSSAAMIIGAAFLVALLWFGYTKLRFRSGTTQDNVSAAVTTEAVPEHGFSYSMVVQKYRNGKPYQKPYTIPGEINFEPDDRVQLLFTAAEQGYLYLINKGPELRGPENCMILFPDNGKSALIEAQQTVQVPSPSQNPADDWIAFDKEQGTEQLWMIWSTKPVPLFETVKKWSNSKDFGEIKDAAEERQVREFLSAHEADSAPAKRDSQTSTTVAAHGELLTYRINLQHH